ncbi:MAG: hypothetical protein WD971_09125 [Pirellulales bacterium]
MDAFENLIAMLLRRDGYWTSTSFKVELTKEDKHAIERSSSPRWEIDVVAYKGSINELLAVECKSYLDSNGIKFRNDCFEPPTAYKMFSDPTLRKVVLNRLKRQLSSTGACAKNLKVKLCLAAGHIASVTKRDELKSYFEKHGWELFDEQWIFDQLEKAAKSGYENDVAHVVAKLITRNRKDALKSASEVR